MKKTSLGDQCENLAARIDADIDTGAFKNVLAEHRENFHDFLIAEELIKKYIQTHDCILYGGIAIDYALRLRGDKIYSDTEIPDFDFWSPTFVETAIEIINILTAHLPGINIYGTRAKFVRTLRISVGDNNWVADISYVPRDLFIHLPTLVFDGMRIIHPHFQLGDLHSSLTYPYDGAPSEVVFARWKKDITRMDKLIAAYPVDEPFAGTSQGEEWSAIADTTQISVPRVLIAHTVLQGFAAYSVYYNALVGEPSTTCLTDRSDLKHIMHARAPKISGDENILIDVPYDVIEVLAHRDAIPRYTAARNPRRFYPLLDLFEASAMCTIGSSPPATLIAYTSFSRLVSYNSFSLPGSDLRIRAISIHGLLKYFIASYLRAKFLSHTITGPTVPAQIYLAYYVSCLRLIKLSRETPCAHYFEPALTSFGEATIPLHDLISLYGDVLRLIAPDKLSPGASPRDGLIVNSRVSDELILPPKNLRATRGDESQPATAAPFSYDSCTFLRISGEEALTS